MIRGEASNGACSRAMSSVIGNSTSRRQQLFLLGTFSFVFRPHVIRKGIDGVVSLNRAITIELPHDVKSGDKLRCRHGELLYAAGASRTSSTPLTLTNALQPTTVTNPPPHASPRKKSAPLILLLKIKTPQTISLPRFRSTSRRQQSRHPPPPLTKTKQHSN